MRFAVFLALFVCAHAAPDKPGPLARDVAAVHAEGKWTIRKAELYGHLVRYYGGEPNAKLALDDYLRERMIQAEARKRKLTVTDDDVDGLIAETDATVRKRSGGTTNLDAERKRQGMTTAEFRRRFRAFALRERVARAIANERDKTRKPDKKLEESTIVLTIDELYNNAKKTLDPEKLPKGVFARVGEVEITEYQYGRELSFTMPKNTVLNALNDLVLAEEVKLLIGNDDPPTAEELAAERKWFIAFEVNRVKRDFQARNPRAKMPAIGLDTVKQILARRGLTLELALSNPASLAQARARGYFRRSLDDEQVRAYYETNKDRYGDQLKVARILIAARAQPVKAIGRKIRSLSQGKAEAEALYLRAAGGADFGELAKKHSDDSDVIRKHGGLVPLWMSAAMPGYQDTWAHANLLKEGEISKPFYSRSGGGGYVLVKLMKRRKALGYAEMRDTIMLHASEQAYRSWRDPTLRKAQRSQTLLEKD